MYQIILFFSENENEYINITLKKEDDGKNIDLTKNETEGWSVEYNNSEGKTVFVSVPDNSDYVLFKSGTLYVKRAGETMDFEIKLENGKIQDTINGTDDKEHTVSLLYKGKLELVEK